MKYIKLPKNFFKKLKFKVEASPFGKKLCCCGHTQCVDLNCYNYCNVKYDYLNGMTMQEYDILARKQFNAYKPERIVTGDGSS